MTESPRVALILSGLPRLWKPSLQTQMDLLQKYPHDVFFHFWDTIDDAEKNEILALLKPRAWKFEKPQDFSRYDNDPKLPPDLINPPSRTMSQYYSWREAARLAEPFIKDYDIGIRSRADLQFVYSLDHIIPRIGAKEMVVNWWEPGRTFSDLFAAGGIEPVLHFHTLFDHVYDYTAGGEFNPEIMMTKHLKSRPEFTIYAEPERLFFVRRPHMANYTAEQAMREDPGRNKWLDPEVVKAHAQYHAHKSGEQGAAYIQRFQRDRLGEMIKDLREKIEPEKK